MTTRRTVSRTTLIAAAAAAFAVAGWATSAAAQGPPDVVWQTEGHVRVEAVAFSPDGQMLATAGGYNDETVKLWRTSDGSAIRTLAGHTGDVYSVTFSPDGAYIASGSRDHTVKLWRVSDGSMVWTRSLHGTGNWIWSVRFSPDGQLIAAAGADDYLTILSAADGSVVHEMDLHWSVEAAVFSPDGQLLVCVTGIARMNIYRVSDWSLIRAIDGAHDFVAFSQDGQLVAAQSSGNILNLYRVTDGSVARSLVGHTDTVRSIAFSPDGRLLFSGASDQTIRVWNVETGALLKTYDPEPGSNVYGIDCSGPEPLFAYGAFPGFVGVARNPLQGELDCGVGARLKIKKCEREGRKIVGRLKGATPATVVTFTLDAQNAAEVTTGPEGAARIRYRHQPRGTHTLRVCTLEAGC